MSTQAAWWNVPPPQAPVAPPQWLPQQPKPGLLRRAAPHVATGSITALLVAAATWYFTHKGPDQPAANVPAAPTAQPQQPATRKCGKCGSEDCGCQQKTAPPQVEMVPKADADALAKKIEELQKALDEAKAGAVWHPRETSYKTAIEILKKQIEDLQGELQKAKAKPQASHIVGQDGRWWTSARAEDPDQRMRYSRDEGQTWYRESPALTACGCHNTGPDAHGLCVCHQTGRQCVCHVNEGTKFSEAQMVNLGAPAYGGGMPAMRASGGG